MEEFKQDHIERKTEYVTAEEMRAFFSTSLTNFTGLFRDQVGRVSLIGGSTVGGRNVAILAGAINADGEAVALLNGIVSELKLVDAAVTAVKIATGAVLEAKLADAAVSTAKIAGLAVDNTKLANLSVDAAKLADSAVTSTKIANLAVGTAAIANLAVGTAQIADAAILEAKIGNLAVSSAKIANLAVIDAKIDTLSANKIIAGTGIINALSVLNTLTMGSAGTDGIIQSYGWDGTVNGFRILGGATPSLTVIGGTITGGLIQTDAGATAGIKIDSTSLRGYDDSNNKTFELVRATGVISATDADLYVHYQAGENITAGKAVCLKGSLVTKTAGSSDHDVSVKNTVAGQDPAYTETLMYVGSDDSNNLRFSYLRFASLTDVTGFGEFSKAVLRLHHSTKVGTITVGIELRRITATWNEDTLSGDALPTQADLTHDRIAKVADGLIPNNSTFDIDITNLLRMWINTGYSNFGIQIRPAAGSTGNNYYRFGTSEHGTPPQIVVTSEITSDSKIYHADNSNYNLARNVVGIASAAITSGNYGNVQYAGKVAGSGTIIKGRRIYVGVNGSLITALENVNYIVPVGVGTDVAEEIQVRVDKPVFIEKYHDANDFSALGYAYAQLAVATTDTWECAAPPEATRAVILIRRGANILTDTLEVRRADKKYDAYSAYETGTRQYVTADWGTNTQYILIQYLYSLGADIRVQVFWYRD